MSRSIPFDEAYRGRRMLVTGGSGFIGAWVARALANAGAKLSITGRREDRLREAAEMHGFMAEFIVADLSRPGEFKRIFESVRPHVTFHLAGYGVDPAERDAQQASALNAQLAAEVAETVAAGKATDWPGLRLVQAGSAAEYGSMEGAVRLDSPERPLNLYGETKLAGTRALTAVVARTGLRAATARLFTVYGPGEHTARLLPSLLATANSGGVLELTAGEQKRDFTFVQDVAEGLLRLGATQNAVPPVMNLATGVLTAVREFAERAARLLGLRESQLRFGALATRTDELHQGPVDVAPLRALLGWVPPTAPERGIRQTIEFWTKAHGVRA